MAGRPAEGYTGGVANDEASRAAGLRGGVLVPSLAAAVALAVLVSLGLWQLDRLAWKEGLIATLEQRLSAPPVALPPPAEWPRLTAARDEFLRVTLRAAFQNDREALVYAPAGSSMRREATRQAWAIGCSHRPVSPTARS